MPALDPEARAKFARMENAILLAHDQLLSCWKTSFAAGSHWEATTLDSALSDLTVARVRLLDARRAYLMSSLDMAMAQRILGTHAYRARALVNALSALDRTSDTVAPLNDLLNDLVTLLDQLPAERRPQSGRRNLRVI